MYDVSQSSPGSRNDNLGYHKTCSVAQIYANSGDFMCAVYPTGYPVDSYPWYSNSGAWSGGSNVCVIACQD